MRFDSATTARTIDVALYIESEFAVLTGIYLARRNMAGEIVDKRLFMSPAGILRIAVFSWEIYQNLSLLSTKRCTVLDCPYLTLGTCMTSNWSCLGVIRLSSSKAYFGMLVG